MEKLFPYKNTILVSFFRYSLNKYMECVLIINGGT
jgi:hypothetical protein